MLTMKKALYVLFGLFLISCASSSVVQGNSASDGSGSSDKEVFARFEPSPDWPWVYRLSVKCLDQKCPISVELVKREIVVSSHTLDWPTDNSDFEAVDPDSSFGITDPLDDTSNISTWRIGSDEQGIGISARLIQLDPNQWGLLLVQVIGFEHVKRIHELYVAESGKLRRAWTVSEQTGPAWNSVTIIPNKDRQSIVLFSGFQPDSGDKPDTLDIEAFIWDTPSKTLNRTEPPDLYGVVASVFTSATAARQARFEGGECFPIYWILPADRFDNVKSTGLVLAVITTEKKLAEAESDRIKNCAKNVTISRATSH